MRKINTFAACMMCTCLVWAQGTASFQQEIAEKAKGLEIVGGGIPGVILVAGEPAFPLVWGRIGNARVPVAAATRMGNGRVVALSHQLFVLEEGMQKPSNAAFVRSALTWLAGGVERPKTLYYDARMRGYRNTLAPCKDSQIEAINSLDQLKDIVLPAVVLLSPESHSLKDMPKVRAFIERGGGVLCSVVGWGWYQINQKSFKTESAFNALLGPAGLYTGDYSASPVEGKFFKAVGRSTLPMSCAEALQLAQGTSTLKSNAHSARQASFLLSAFWQILPDDERRYRPQIADMFGGDRPQPVPSPEHPIGVEQLRDRLALTAFQDDWLREPAKVWPAHPAAKTYPGVPESKQRETRTVAVDLSVPRWHGTGLFAVAGEPLTVTLPQGMEKAGLRLRIGTTTCRVTAHEKWSRAPVVDVEVPLNKTETRLSSPFGGMVYVVVPDGKKGTAQVKIGPACPAPWFVKGRDIAASWRETLRNLPAPMAEIESDKVVFTVPSSLIREMEDPLPLLGVWSEIMDLDAWLTVIPAKRSSPERFCIDKQLCAGFMHAGYPLMVPSGSAHLLLDAQTVREGKAENLWGFFHEMGHNHQNYDWTFDGTVEVTVNFFTLYCMEKICGFKPRQTRMGSPSIKRKYEAWLAAGHPFDQWKSDPFLALEFFLRLQERYGWEAFRKMFAEYRTLPKSERPKNDYEKRKQWAQRFSRIVGEDIYEQFNMLRNPGEPPFTPPQEGGQK